MIRFLALLVVVAATVGTMTAVPRIAAQDSIGAQDSGKVYFCPMHPDVTSATPGRCRKCDMEMLLGDPFDTRDYRLDVAIEPPDVRPKVPFELTLTVGHPATGDVVQEFEVVHDRQYHLFLISHDLSFFEHIHPTQGDDGRWAINAEVPKPGFYRVLSDFVPKGASPQFLSRSIATAGFDGDLESQAPELDEDWQVEKTVDGLVASVSIEPNPLVEGQWGHLTFSLRDAASGAPVTDLQPYLAAFGHTLMMSGDMRDYVHSHPTPRPENDIARGFGGPQVEFEGYMPRAGYYRAWTQFQRAGRISTFPFTFRVLTLDESVGRAGTSIAQVK